MHKEDDPNKSPVGQNNTVKSNAWSFGITVLKSKWILIGLNIYVFKKQAFPSNLLVNELFNQQRFYVSFIILEICVDT